MTLEMYGQTYMYTYPPDEAEQMLDVITLQALAGRIPALVADIVAETVIGGIDER